MLSKICGDYEVGRVVPTTRRVEIGFTSAIP